MSAAPVDAPPPLEPRSLGVLLKRGSVGPAVSALQQQLAAILRTREGQAPELAGAALGKFDVATGAAVRRYQREAGLPDDGIVGPATRAALRADTLARGQPGLEGFRGRLGFLLSPGLESHAGQPYWPGGASGVTLDPGFDLRWQPEGALRDLYGPLCTAEQLEALVRALGLRGVDALACLRDPQVAAVRIGREAAAERLPRIAAPYWAPAQRYCPALTLSSAPAGAHTALLSLAYQAGADALRRLRAPAERGDWRGVAAALERLPIATRRRRALEAHALRLSLPAE